jgi:hypothetical protein
MACANQVGVKNLTLAFTDCRSGDAGGIGNVKATSHIMAQDALPELDSVPYKLTGLSAGRVKLTYKNASIKLNIVRNLAVPLSYYQGRASMDVQIEFLNGGVMTGIAGAVTEPQASDGNEVNFTVEFDSLSEILSPSAPTLS